MSWREVSRWERPYASLVRSDGPIRVVTDEPMPEGWVTPRFVGFIGAPGEPVDVRELEWPDDIEPGVAVMPLLWEGDQA